MNDQTVLTLRIIRILDATCARIFDAWTNPNSDTGWWGPKDFTLLFHESDLKPGGWWRMGIRREAETRVLSGVYREIVPPERLVMTSSWEDAEGNAGPETLVTLTLTDHDSKARMVFEQTGFQSSTMRDSQHRGWNEAFDALTSALARTAQAAR